MAWLGLEFEEDSKYLMQIEISRILNFGVSGFEVKVDWMIILDGRKWEPFDKAPKSFPEKSVLYISKSSSFLIFELIMSDIK
jgi:hypothetical protein